MNESKPFKFQIGDLVETLGWRDEDNCIIIEQCSQQTTFPWNQYRVYSSERMDNFLIREENIRLMAR